MIRKELSFVRAALFIFLMFDVTTRRESQAEEVGSIISIIDCISRTLTTRSGYVLNHHNRLTRCRKLN